MSRVVRNVGIMDAAPVQDMYGEFLSGEFIVTNLGFARDDPERANWALQTMLSRNLSALAVRNVYGVPLSKATLEANRASGTPLILYEGAYHEQVVFQALNLIQRDSDECDKGRRIDGLIADRSEADVRAALFGIAGATGATLQCSAFRLSGRDDCSLYAILDELSNELASFKRAWDCVETVSICRYHDVLLAFVSYSYPPVGGISHSESDLIARFGSRIAFSCGFSEEVPLGEGDLAIRQALAALDQACEEGTAVVRWADLGCRAFQVAARADALLQRTCALHRRALEAYDDANSAGLCVTARAFANAFGDVRATAQALYQHPNTVRYRLKKIKAALGMPEVSDRELARFLVLVFLV